MEDTCFEALLYKPITIYRTAFIDLCRLRQTCLGQQNLHIVG